MTRNEDRGVRVERAAFLTPHFSSLTSYVDRRQPMQRISNRRDFLQCCGTILAASTFARAGDPLKPSRQRATDGDDAFHPDWDQKLTLTVGPDKADLVGKDDKVLQAALDYVARLGGGTVKVLPGTYTLRNAVFLPSGVRLLGSGQGSVLTKIPSRTVALSEDSDWYDQEVTLADADGFEVGDGVVFRATNPHNSGATVIKRTLVARTGNRFKLDDGLRENLWLSGEPKCSALFPLLTSERTADVVIEDITLDGDRANNENFNGNYGGGIFLQDCNRYSIRGVTSRNYNGDGVSFQICHDVLVEKCHLHDNADLGIHPGSGSQRPVLRDNKIERNTIGIFWCWGVKHGLAERNKIDASRDFGISIGHNDTDNVMRDNDVTGSGKVGVLFRDETRGKDFWPNRNVIENNRVTDSGGEDGIAIDIRGKTKDVRISNNTLRETRGPAKRMAIRVSPTAERVQLENNTMQGFAVDVARA